MNKIREFFLAYCRFLADDAEDLNSKITSFVLLLIAFFLIITLTIMTKGFVFVIALILYFLYKFLVMIGKMFKENDPFEKKYDEDEE